MGIEWKVLVEQYGLRITLILWRFIPMIFSKIESKFYPELKVLNGIQIVPDNIPFSEKNGYRKTVNIVIKNITYYSDIEMVVMIINLNDISEGFSFSKIIKHGEERVIEIPFFLNDLQIKVIREMPSVNINGDAIFSCNNRRIKKSIPNFQVRYENQSWFRIGS